MLLSFRLLEESCLLSLGTVSLIMKAVEVKFCFGARVFLCLGPR